MSFIYAPVSTHRYHQLNFWHPHCLFNPVRQMPDLRELNVDGEYFADCGGYQLYQYSGSGTKRCLVVPRAKIQNGKDFFVIDPLELCERYGMMGIKYGFTVDQPMSDEQTETEFYLSLKNGHRWAKLMIDYRPKLCPETQLLIPLHFNTKSQLHHCYDEMSTLNPDGYAFAMRGDFDLPWIVRIALTLSFLHSKNVKKVHMFGSSRREVMVIGAAAIGLEMFEQLSFDSRTWNTRIWNGPSLEGSKYYDAESNKWKYVGNERLDIVVPSGMLQDGNLPEIADEQLSMQMLMLHNAYSISQQAALMATKAQDLDDYREYIKENIGGLMKDRLLQAIQILEDAVCKDYEFVENWMQRYWH